MFDQFREDKPNVMMIVLLSLLGLGLLSAGTMMARDQRRRRELMRAMRRLQRKGARAMTRAAVQVARVGR